MTIIDKAFILAAGLGTRLRPYTNDIPKPLVMIDGKTLIDHALDHLESIGIKEVIVNTHYKADLLEAHLSKRNSPHIIISREDELLETGGGIKKALNHFGNDAFITVSSDWLWNDNVSQILQNMTSAWDHTKMDLLMLLQPLVNMTLTTGSGDYDIDARGRLTRSLTKSGANMWTSVRIVKPSLFENTPDGPFSFLTLMDHAEKQKRLYGIVQDTYWHHISTAQDLENVREALNDNPDKKFA